MFIALSNVAKEFGLIMLKIMMIPKPARMEPYVLKRFLFNVSLDCVSDLGFNLKRPPF